MDNKHPTSFSKASTERVSKPGIRLPEADEKTGPRTLLTGIGWPGAQVEVWDKDEMEVRGKGKVNDNSLWVFSVIKDLAERDWEFKARQTIDGQVSEWSELRAFSVTRTGVAAPLIEYPTGDAPLPDPPMFSGRGLNGATVSVYNVNTWEAVLIATVPVEGEIWRTPDLPPFHPGTYNVSAIQTLDGKASDWSVLLTFEVKRPA